MDPGEAAAQAEEGETARWSPVRDLRARAGRATHILVEASSGANKIVAFRQANEESTAAAFRLKPEAKRLESGETRLKREQCLFHSDFVASGFSRKAA